MFLPAWRSPPNQNPVLQRGPQITFTLPERRSKDDPSRAGRNTAGVAFILQLFIGGLGQRLGDIVTQNVPGGPQCTSVSCLIMPGSRSAQKPAKEWGIILQLGGLMNTATEKPQTYKTSLRYPLDA
jgi:hypothetical protein